MYSLPDNFDRWQDHDNLQEAWLQSRPLCDCCRERIQNEGYHRIGNTNMCDRCYVEMARVRRHRRRIAAMYAIEENNADEKEIEGYELISD